MEKTQTKINNSLIPEYVTRVTKTLEKNGFQVFLVGGCVRDLIMEREPNDWDITTNAKPEEIISLFEKTVYENKFGTVGVCIPKEQDSTTKILENVTCETPKNNDIIVSPETSRASCRVYNDATRRDSAESTARRDLAKSHIIEVTPYRIEAKYSDFRHPDEVKYSDNIEDDLKRRDFTINALAYNPSKGQIIDLYNGQKDIKDKIIRAVGTANDRFNEDALRMIRAIRFSTQLGFVLSSDTTEAISENAHLLKNISFERIRDEFIKIIMSNDPVIGIALLLKLGLLKYMIPELEEGIKCEQKGAHIYDVWEHLLHALGHACNKNWPLEIRLSALFHDIGKPKTRRWDATKSGGEGKYTFYGHEVVGARMTKQIMDRLKFPIKTTELVVKLVRGHMFFSDTEMISLSAVRRVVSNVGKEHIWDLMKVRECDRVGMKKKEAPFRLRKYHAMIEEVLHDPISVSQLAIDGEYMIKELGIKPSPRMGWILSALLEEVLDDPTKNKKEHLGELVASLNILGDAELKILGERGKEKKEKLEEEEVTKLHKKHGV
ncbi:MAG: HD domain-containing protein [Candidatus Pacebacteria bacterium]|nr:HD domain-containing protein [Candidatus Paceibacterota bacterium]